MANYIDLLRKDASGTYDGLEIGALITLAAFQDSWLIPNVTFTAHRMTDAGTKIIPTLTTKDGDTTNLITALCVNGNSTELTLGELQLQINKKVSNKFDGCFVTAGIANREFSDGMNMLKIEQMRNQFLNEMHKTLTDGATASQIDAPTAGKYVEYSVKRIAEYTKANKMRPTVALVSSDMAMNLLLEKIQRQTPAGDSAAVTGEFGQINLVRFIEVPDQTEDMILINYNALHIGSPTNVGQLMGSNAAYAGALTNKDAEMNKGVIALEEINAAAGMAYTWIHKFFGAVAVSQYAIKPKAVNARSAK